MGTISYRGFRFPPSIIQHAIWLYVRFGLSLRNVEDLLAERGIEVVVAGDGFFNSRRVQFATLAARDRVPIPDHLKRLLAQLDAGDERSDDPS